MKLGLEDASASVFLTVRSVGASLALMLVSLWIARHQGLRARLRMPKDLLIKAIAIGILLQVAYQTTYFLALDYQLTPGVLAIILGLQPILTPLFANEKNGRLGYFYLILGLAGLTIAVVGARELGAITAAGVLCGLASVIAISAGSVMQKKCVIDPVTSAFYQAMTASCIFLAVLPLTDVELKITPTFLASAAWMVVVVSTLATLLLFRMLAKHSASKVGVLFYITPVLTMLLDYLVFGNRVTWVTFAGALLVVAAVKGFGRVQAAHAVVASKVQE